MSDSEEYYSEDVSVSNETPSDRISLSSTPSRGRGAAGSRQSGEVTILDTDSEEDEMPVRRPNAVGRRAAAIISESEDDDEMEQRALSPRTRMSITGVRPQDVSDDDSSVIDYSDNEDSTRLAANESADGISIPPKDLQSHNGDLDSNSKIDNPRYSTQFIGNIGDVLHSTLFPISEQESDLVQELEQELDKEQHPETGSGNSSSSDVLIMSVKETPIEISSSSDFDETRNKDSQSPCSSSARCSSSGIKSENVSRDFYDKELRNVSNLRLQLSEAEKLYEKVAHRLPDKGTQILKRIDGLRMDIAKKASYLEGVNVQQETAPSVKRMLQPTLPMKPPKPLDKELDWDDLSNAVNLIQPKYTGTQGMATFNTQKALTMDSLKDLHGSLKGCPDASVLADDPAGLKVQLMDHQKHALAWMFWRETQRPRGGILADDMGLGKTLTMISLVLACKNRQESGSEQQSENEEDSDDEEHNKPGDWYSKNRKDKNKGGTLVVCPASLLRQWESEVSSKLSRHRLTVCVHHGPNRETKAKHLRTYDIVVTTYQIVAREHKHGGAVVGVRWRRIILDEAHMVRNYKSQSSISVNHLHGKYRWTLTGTPIQNKECDVYALLKFLRCSPFDDLATWKRWIDNKSQGGQERLNLLMRSIMLRRTKAQLQTDGKLNSLPKKDIRLVEINLDKAEMNVYQKVMTYSRSLFAQFLQQRAEKDSNMHYVQDAQRPTHNQLKDPNGAYYKMHQRFARMAGHGNEVKSHEILMLLLRLRQICCHPGLIDAMLEEESVDSMQHGGDSAEASHEIDLLAQLNKLTIEDGGGIDSVDQPLGGEESRLAKASQNVLKRSNPVFDYNRPSTKLVKALEIIKAIVLSGNDKAVVVSQWKSVLDILRGLLDKERIATLALNGTIPVKNRQDIVNEFNNPLSAKHILLLSLTAGGVGLNLIGGNHLILLDLHWNPQLEAQAQDRIYRVGQKKDVVIYKIICMDTVEQRIKALQDRKLELADCLLTGKVSTKLSIDDLKGLFGM